MVEISQWRHAIVNFPHPLLKQGLVIIDTPGLNAIGTEPELTLNLIPNAHAVLFILAADTGVTKSDIEVWRDHIGGGAGRMVVLNKIDSMWDELRTPQEVDAQIAAPGGRRGADAGPAGAAGVPGVGAKRPGRQDRPRCRIAAQEPPAGAGSGAVERADPGTSRTSCARSWASRSPTLPPPGRRCWRRARAAWSSSCWN